MDKRIIVFTVLLLCTPMFGQEDIGAFEDLAKIKTMCVQRFIGVNPAAAQTQEMAIAQLFKARLFRLTEKCDKADAVIYGSITLSSNQIVQGDSDSVEVGRAAGSSRGNLSGSIFDGTGSISGSSSSRFGAIKIGDSESVYYAGTIREASITLRITNADGDILWAHIEEAKAGKTKGPVAFAMDRAIRRLSRDIRKARNNSKSSNE